MSEGCVAPRYLTRFGCTGSSCEDTCCADWRIHVDDEHYRALGAKLKNDPADQALFARALQRTPGSGGKQLVVIQLDEHQNCPYLDGEKLCSLHRRFGEPLLGNACSMYPRMVGRVGDRVEVGAELSCPEVARLCLLADDAMELVPVPRAVAGRGVVRQRLPDGREAELFDTIRSTMDHLLAQRRFPSVSRIFFTAYFAHRLTLLAAGKPDPARVAAEARLLHSDGALDQLHRQLEAAPVAESIAGDLIVVILGARLESPLPRACARLTAAVIGGYCDEASIDREPGLGAALRGLGATRLRDGHRRRAGALPDDLRPRLDLALENYCRSYWRQEWLVGARSPMHHLQSLLVRVAMLRFLLVGHPSLADLPEDATARRARFDRIIVEVFYSFSRGIAHNDQLHHAIARALESSRMLTLAHSVSLLKF